MDTADYLQQLRDELRDELVHDILPYWSTQTLDEKNGGFIGRISHDNKKVYEASKGIILNARILWTYAASYRALKSTELKNLAQRSYTYLSNYFLDDEYGGAYWMVQSDGSVEVDQKYIYAQAFVIYALAEYYQVVKNPVVLNDAKRIFELLEQHSFDKEQGGYFEAYSRDWTLLDDVRLSDKDLNVAKSMNTHLHILEAYTNLYRCWPEKYLRQQLENLIEVLIKHIINTDGTALIKFMDADWARRSSDISFGHDIEASWLLTEAAEVLDDEALLDRVQKASLKLTDAVYKRGITEEGGIYNDMNPQEGPDGDKDFWPQVEAIVGFVNGFEISGREKYLEAAWNVWEFCKQFFLDQKYGEWYERIDEDNRPHKVDKVQNWKGPYHNSRGCLEIMRRVNELQNHTDYKIKTAGS